MVLYKYDIALGSESEGFESGAPEQVIIIVFSVKSAPRTSVDFGIQMCSVAGARLPLADIA
jgi:hypothetical protein